MADLIMRDAARLQRGGSVKLPYFPASILVLLRQMANDAGDTRKADALTALRWIAAAYSGYDSSAFVLTVFYKNPFEISPKHFCQTEIIQGNFVEGEAGWNKAVDLALRNICRRERRCNGSVVAASLRQEISMRVRVFQVSEWGGNQAK